jgi:hypothetical protein
MRTKNDGLIMCRISCQRELYVVLDPRLTSIFDAQDALSKLLVTYFSNVLVP